MKNSNTKLICVPSRGRVITSRGYISTPIVRPYRETLDNIFKMLTSKPKPTILEVLPDGRKIELTTLNFDKDNTLIRPEISVGSVTPSVNNAETKDDDKVQKPSLTNPEVPSHTEEQVNAVEVVPEEVQEVANAENAEPVDDQQATTEETSVEVTPEEAPVETVESNDNNYRSKKKNKNRYRNNNNNQQATTEETSVEVTPEEVQ